MQIKIKTYIIVIIISFFVGGIITGSTIFFFSSRASQHDEAEIKRRDIIIDAVRSELAETKNDLEAAKNEITGIIDVNKQLEQSTDDNLVIIDRIKRSQSEIRQCIESGIKEK